MILFSRILSLALLLISTTLHAQWMRFGLDGLLGMHYNTLDAASYKTPVGNGGVGGHLTIADPDDPMRVYFNGRLTFENDFQTYTVFGNIKQDFAFRDLISSFQMHKRLNERLSVYAGINFSVNVINTIWLRTEGSAFTHWGQRTETLEAEVRQRIRKLNAGLEAGFVCPLGSGFSTGLHFTYYILKRLEDDLELGSPGSVDEASLNFRPLALKWLLAFDLN